MICCFRQKARSTEHVNQMLSNHAFVNRKICSCFVNNTSERCSSVSACFGVGEGESGVIVFVVALLVLDFFAAAR